MGTLTINGRRVRVDDSFAQLSPELQQKTVEEIAAQMGGAEPQRAPSVNMNVSDRFDALPKNAADPAPGTYSGNLENAAAGINGFLRDVASAPVEASRNAINWGIAGANKLRGAEDLTEGMIPEGTVLSRKWLTDRMESVGVVDPDRIVPANELQRIIRAGTEGATMTLAPEMALAALSKVGIFGARAENILGQIFGRAASVRSAAGNAVAGGFAGAGAQAASDAAPEPWKPLAAFAGGLTGAVASTGVTALPQLARSGIDIVRDFTAPLWQAGRERLVGRQLNDAASHPGQVIDDLQQVDELVPGAKPTTFQQSGDMGLGALERSVQTKSPEAFNQRRADQNAARMRALEGVERDGAAETVAAQVRSVLADVDRVAGEAVEQARQSAARSADNVGQAMRPEEAGRVLQQGLERRRADAVEIERRLWEAVDPDGSLVLPPQATKDVVAAINREHSGLAKPFGSEETGIYHAIGTTEDVIPFRDMSALRSRVSTAIADERARSGKSPAWARLVQLRGAIENDLENAVANKVMLEQQAVARGEMRVEDTIEAAIQRQREAWFGEAAARAQHGGGGSRSAGNTASGPRPVSGVRGATSEGGRGFGAAPRDPRLSQDARGAAAQDLTLADIRAKPADDPFFVRSRDGQVFVPGPGGSPDLGSAPLPGSKTLVPIRIGRRDLVQHIGNAAHKADAEILGYPDQWAMLRDVVANWDRLHEAFDGRLMLVKLNTDLRHGAAVVELTPTDGGRYYRIKSVSRARPEQLGNLIDDRMHYPNEGAGTPSPAGSRPRSETGRTSTLASGVDQPEYTPRPFPVQARPFDAAAKARLDRATEGTRRRAETFDNPQIAHLHQKRMDSGDFLTPSSSAAAWAFKPGPGGYQRLQTYFKANPSREARDAIEGVIVEQLRNKVLRDDGTLDPAKLSSWLRQHEDAFRAFPELKARIGNAGRASELLAEKVAAQKAAVDEAQRDILGKVIGVSDPEDVTRVVGSIFGRADSIHQMKLLRSAVGTNTEAQQGLRKAVADYILKRFVGNTEAATSGQSLLKSDQLQTFIRQNRGALRVAGFTDDELQMMDRIAQSLQQSSRSLTAVKIPGQSNTAQDVLATRANESTSSRIIKVLALGASSGGGLVVGGGVGAVVAPMVTAVVQVLRQNGIQRMDELLRDAMLDPALARALMIKATPKDIRRATVTIAQRLRRATTAGVLATDYEGNREPVEITVRGGRSTLSK